MRIAVDAMGGDHAPREIVRGAVDYALSSPDEVILVGDVPRLEREIATHGKGMPTNVRLVDAPEVIGMGEHPATALRTKRRSSIVVATNLVRSGDADAVVSAGSTGATMAAAVFRLGRVEGIDRPALPAHMLTPTGPVMLLDVGANVDSDAENLVQFAAMGGIFAEHVLHVEKPRIGLLNIGEESEKGHLMAREAHEKLANADMRFVGNVVIKFFEGITSFIFRALREDLQQGPIAPLALLALKPGFDRMKARFDYEKYGGAPLLGVKGVSIVTHGRAKARMIENAIRVASESAHAGVPDLIAAWTRDHPALAHRGVRDRIAARLHRERA